MNNIQMANRIRKERKEYEADENLIHNRLLHQQIIATWERDSPKMMKELRSLKLVDDMAFVAQERMWRRTDELEESGMPPTDAREIAEREYLMLEPEETADEMEPSEQI